MKIFYSVEIQMKGTYEVTDAVLETASHLLGFGKSDIEDQEVHCVTATFSSDVPPTKMHDYVRSLLTALPEIYYIDTIYRFEYEMTPDRFVIWWDGRTQEYTGKVHFTEDK